MKDEKLLKSTNYRKTIENALKSDLIPAINLQITWEPPSKEICVSSIAKHFHDKGLSVIEQKNEIKTREELTMRVPEFSSLENCPEIVEYLAMLSLNCQMSPDEYLSSYEVVGDMTRVRGVKVIKMKGFYSSDSVREILKQLM